VTGSASGKIVKGRSVQIHFTVTSEGRVLETTKGKPPLYYVQGNPKILPAMQAKLEGLEQGASLEFVLGPEEAYGPYRPEAVIEVSRSEMPDSELKVGMMLQETLENGQIKVGRLEEIREKSVLMNFNHPMAGKTLHYHVEVVSVMDSLPVSGMLPRVEGFPTRKPKPEEE